MTPHFIEISTSNSITSKWTWTNVTATAKHAVITKRVKCKTSHVSCCHFPNPLVGNKYLKKFTDPQNSGAKKQTCDIWLVRTQNKLYRGADKSLARPTSQYILFDGENISFNASLVLYVYIYIYINSTNISTIMIINRIYETQIFCCCSLFPSWSG